MIYTSILIEENSIKEYYDDDILKMNELCYQYPLVFFEKDFLILFFSQEIKLEPKEYNLLFNLVKNNTEQIEKNKKSGITPKKLYKSIKCSSKEPHKDEDYDLRIIKYKSDIFSKIRKEFIIYQNPDNKKDVRYKNIVETTSEGQKWCLGYRIDENSPYYNFNITSSLDRLIYSAGNKKSKKYTTDFTLAC